MKVVHHNTTLIVRKCSFYFLSFLSVSSCLISMEIQQKNIFVPKALGKLSVVKDDDHFTVIKNGNSFSVGPDRLDSVLRKLDKKKLVAFLKTGYLSVNKSKDGSYSLQSHTRIRGGGPFLASVLYGVTKGVCYGVGFAGAALGVAATGGGVVGLVGGVAVGGASLGMYASVMAAIEGLSTAAFALGMLAPTP